MFEHTHFFFPRRFGKERGGKKTDGSECQLDHTHRLSLKKQTNECIKPKDPHLPPPSSAVGGVAGA